MLFDIAALWLIAWILKNAAMDVMYAASGKPNPRWELKRAKARAAGQHPPVQPRYGTRDWFDDLLADGMQAQTEWRRRKAAAKRQARELAEAEEAERVDGPDDGPAGRPLGDPVDQPVARPVNDRAPGAGLDDWPVVEPVCEQRAGNQTSGSADGEAAGPEQQQSPRPTEAPGEQPWAKVIPFRTTNPQEEPVSTDVHTEVIGLDQSIAYARSLATFAGEHGQAGNEGYLGHLTSQKVEGAALQTAHEMQEAFSNAVAAAEAHAEELLKQKAVQEAFDANPDAGDKAFQTEGR